MSTTFIVKMATTGVGFRWLDLLEKEFDKACVELDTSLTELETEEPEVVFSARQKIATLSSCFAQLTHKALTIFQNSAKLEAELVDMRAELVHARASSTGGCQDNGDGAGIVPEAARARAEAAQLARENAALRETVLALHSELYGARLATKYLDKELAGRIQQLQLLGRDMRAEVRDSLWAQVEAEILLQRHKTLVRVCRGVSPRPAAPAPPAPPPHPPHPRHRARPRTVRVRRSPHLGLGISVTGGREHGVPILISELEAGGPAALTGELYVGDAILAINDVDLTQACHKEAVQALQSVKGDCALCVQFIATDDDDRLSEDNYRFPLYPEDGEVFGGEPDGSGATPTAPRTPDYNRRLSEAGSGSECSLTRYGSPYRKPYPDYNSINNNLSILDMDDDNIKIEARLETVDVPQSGHTVHAASTGPVGHVGHLGHAGPTGHLGRLEPTGYVGQLGPTGHVGHLVHMGPTVLGHVGHVAHAGAPGGGGYVGVGGSSADSPHSTPVHTKRNSLKKKRKPQDWRTKGAYRAVEPDAASSDEPSPTSPHPPHPALPTLPALPALPAATARAPAAPASPPLPAPQPPSPPPPQQPRQSLHLPARQSSIPYTDAALTTPVPAASPPREPPAPPSSVDLDSKLIQLNGDMKPVRRESKGFRIGSARRVTDGPAGAPTSGAPVTNGVAGVGKFPHHLVPGDGDPDFGTPV